MCAGAGEHSKEIKMTGGLVVSLYHCGAEAKTLAETTCQTLATEASRCLHFNSLQEYQAGVLESHSVSRGKAVGLGRKTGVHSTRYHCDRSC